MVFSRACVPPRMNVVASGTVKSMGPSMQASIGVIWMRAESKMSPAFAMYARSKVKLIVRYTDEVTASGIDPRVMRVISASRRGGMGVPSGCSFLSFSWHLKLTSCTQQSR